MNILGLNIQKQLASSDKTFSLIMSTTFIKIGLYKHLFFPHECEYFY